MNKKKVLLIVAIVVVALLMIAAAKPITEYWFLLRHQDAYLICPTRLTVERLAPNALYFVCH